MPKGKKMMCLCILVIVSVMPSLLYAAAIPGTAGVTTLQDGPNTEGLFFELNVYYEVFDGMDATDPLGVTPGKKQYAYIAEYVEGNARMKFFDVESTNGVPLIDVNVCSTGTVNGVEPGTVSPVVKLIIPLPSGNPAARFVYPTGLSGPGTRTVMMVYTAADNYDVGLVLAQITDTSLSAAGEVAGPTECFGIIEGSVLCTECDPQGQFLPMEGVTVVVSKDGNEVASAVTDENGKYMFAGLETGQFTVSVQDAENYTACAATSMDVEVACSGSAIANFCVCPPPCTQQICVRVVCDANGEEEAVAYPWIGICGPEIVQWSNAGRDGEKCFNGQNIVPGHYKVKVKPPRGYEMWSDSSQEFDLADCETKELVFYACPIPPCEQSVCISVIEIGDNNEVIPIENVKVFVKQCRDYKWGYTGADGVKCFYNLRPDQYVAEIDVPAGYKVCDGRDKIPFALERCEQEEIEFVLCKIQVGPCPCKPYYWKYHNNCWPINSMWLGNQYCNQQQLMNVLCGKKPDGSYASRYDMTIPLAQNLIAAKLSIAAGSDCADIEPVVIAADEYMLYDCPPGSRPYGGSLELARDLNNKLYKYLENCDSCQPLP